MKHKIAISLLIVFLSAFTMPPEFVKITTTTGVFVLTPPEGCINLNCLKGAIRISQTAGAAVEADVMTASNEEKKLDRELQSASAAYEATGKAYAAAKAPYDSQLALYNTDVKTYDAQTIRMPAEKAAFDNRKAVLDGEKDVLMVQWNALTASKTILNSKLAQIPAINDKINLALEQLNLCKLYGERVMAVSKTKKWGAYRTIDDYFGSLKVIPGVDLLNGELEEMKVWNDTDWH